MNLVPLVDAPPASFRKFIEPLYARVAPEVRDKVLDRAVSVGARVYLNDFQCCDKFDIMDEVHQIKIPTLLICGTQDNMTPPKYSHYLADKISGATVGLVHGGTHLVFLEKPEEVNLEIEEFVENL